MGDATWSITELAAEYDVTLRTLRHYEQLGLLSPERVGTSRVYRQRDRIRLELILRGKRLGFSLDQIGVIVNMYDEPPGEAGQLEFLIAPVRRAPRRAAPAARGHRGHPRRDRPGRGAVPGRPADPDGPLTG